MTVKTKRCYIPKALRRALTEVLDYPMTVLEAGSGYGKTTVVSEYLEKHHGGGCRFLWYTCLGETPKRSWQGICDLLSRVDAATAHALQQCGKPGQETMADIAWLMGKLACAQPTAMVIDNYQLAGFEEPSRLLDALSLHSSPYLHLIVLTQPFSCLGERPAAMNPRILRLKSDCFLFEREDIASLFAQAGYLLSPRDLDLLERTTEGWAAALNLQMSSDRLWGRLQSTGQISRLMDAALWGAMGQWERDFLSALSVLDSFTPRQAAILCGKSPLPGKAEVLLEVNDFIRWDATEGKYRFHTLLRTYLADKLARWPRERLREVHTRAASACAAEGDCAGAARFCLLIGDFTRLLELPFRTEELMELVSMEDGGFVRSLIRACPRETLAARPELLLKFSFELLLRGDLPLFERYYRLLEECARPSESCRSPAAQGERALLESFLAFNDVEAMCRAHERAWALLQTHTRLYCANDSWTFDVPSVVCLFWRADRSLADTLQAISKGLPRYYLLTQGHGVGVPAALEAEMELLAGDDVRAEALCRAALEEAERWRQDSICFCAELTLARICLLRGDWEAFECASERLRARGFRAAERDSVVTAKLCEAFLDLLLGRYEELPDWLHATETIQERVFYTVAVPFAQILRMRLLQKEASRRPFTGGLEGEYRGLIASARKCNMLLPELYFRLGLAACLDGGGRRREAVTELEEALRLALPDRVYLPFAEWHGELAPLLELAQPPGGDRQGLRASVELGKRQRRGVKRLLSRGGGEALTAREREIAELARRGMRNAEIAELLGIAPGTVKVTLERVYRKLEVRSRAELGGKLF